MRLGRFAVIYLATIVGMLVIVLLVQAIARFDISNAGMAIIPAMVAALVEGQSFARAENRLPESREMWRFARRASVIVLGLTMMSAAVFSIAVPEIAYMLRQPNGAAFLLVAILFQTLVSFFLLRLFLASGAKSALKAAGRKADRS